MTPSARVQALIEACQAIEASSAPADRVIAAYFRKRRYAGAKDRRAVIDSVYAILRRQARLDWRIAMDGEMAADDLSWEAKARARIIAYHAICLGTKPLELAALFSGGNRHPAFLSAGEEKLSRLASPLERETMPPWVLLEYPEWLDGALRQSLGGRLASEMAALNQQALLDVRVNVLKCSREEAMQALAGEGIESQATPFSPWGLRLPGRTRLNGTKAFRSGFLEVQDEGSQIIALLAGAKPGMAVVDFCAGSGGKALALAAAMQGGRGLVACDVSKRRLSAMSTRLARAGIKGVRRVSLNEAWLCENQGRFDLALLDAPCTGSGVWRRDIAAKWRLGVKDLQDVIAKQRKILKEASRLVKPSGRMIYATCSVLAAENEEQMEWFLKEHPGFAPVPIRGEWKSLAGECRPGGDPYLRLSPASSGTDGFFAAMLEKKA